MLHKSFNFHKNGSGINYEIFSLNLLYKISIMFSNIIIKKEESTFFPLKLKKFCMPITVTVKGKCCYACLNPFLLYNLFSELSLNMYILSARILFFVHLFFVMLYFSCISEVIDKSRMF